MSEAAQSSRPGNGWILFLDLDETLVHCYVRNDEEPKQFEKLMQLVLKEETDNIPFFYRKYFPLSPNTQATPPNPSELVVVLRPGVRELLHELDREQGYELAIWSAGMPKYIGSLVKILFTHDQLQQHPKWVKEPSKVLCRYQMMMIAGLDGTALCKPLQALAALRGRAVQFDNFDPNKAILFDDQEINRVIQPTQVVKVPPFSPKITQTMDQTCEELGRCLSQDNYLSNKAVSAINTIRSRMINEPQRLNEAHFIAQRQQHSSLQATLALLNSANRKLVNELSRVRKSRDKWKQKYEALVEAARRWNN